MQVKIGGFYFLKNNGIVMITNIPSLEDYLYKGKLITQDGEFHEEYSFSKSMLSKKTIKSMAEFFALGFLKNKIEKFLKRPDE